MWLQVTCPWSQQPPPFPSPGPLQLIFLDLWGTPWATQPLSWLEVLTSASLRNHVYSGASLSLTCFWFQTCRYWAENPNSKFLQILAWHWLPRGLVAPRPSPGQVPALPCFPRRSSPLGPPVKEFPCAWKLLFQGSLPPLGHKLLPRSFPSSFPFLCLPPLCYLISGSLPVPLESWGLLLSPIGCFVGVVPHLDEFLMYLGLGWWFPHLIPPPSSPVSRPYFYF